MIRCEPTEFIDMDDATLCALLDRLETKELTEEDFQILSEMAKSYHWVTREIDKKSASIARLRRLLFGAPTEKTSTVTDRNQQTGTPEVGACLPQNANTSETLLPETLRPETSTPETFTSQTLTSETLTSETLTSETLTSETFTAATFTPAPSSPDGPAASPAPSAPSAPKPKPKGHGRNGVADFLAATHVILVHPELSSRAPCPNCRLGTVYESRPQILLRFTGQAPINVHVYHRAAFRCDVCGKCYVAPLPAGVTEEKYDASVVSIIGLLKYGRGMPFNRLDELQDDLGLPLSASAQWELVFGASPIFSPAFEELIRQAAQGEIVHNDDTTVRILELAKKPRASASAPAAKDAQTIADNPADEEADTQTSDRTGIFTSGIVSRLKDQHQVALFFSGGKHAGENLEEVLKRRAAELPPPIQMCDALSRNYPKDFQTIVANCLAHARRKFVEQHPHFQDECRYVLEQLEQVYINDAYTKKAGLSAEERLRYHQTRSQPILDRLHQWMKDQIDQKRIEKNSGLGGAINYLRKHWDKLTLFLRVAGAPWDNNIVERALKKAILHRKNSLFYKTQRGADVGDMYMSLIFTCDLNDANPFEYVTQLQLHAAEVQAAPERWLPWNYRENLHSVRAGPESPPPTPASG